MKKNTVSLLLAASALVFMAGCAGGAKNSAAQKDETVNESQAQTDAVDPALSLRKPFPGSRQTWCGRNPRRNRMRSFES